LLFLVWRDFKVRYRQTILGISWAVLQPVLTTAVLTMVFAKIADVETRGVPYALFALAGLVPWQFFASGVNTATNGLIANQDLLRRIYLPRIAIPISNVLAGTADLFVATALLIVASLILQVEPSVRWFTIPIFLSLTFASALGIGTILASLNVLFRDVGYAVPFGLQIALFLSPIAYPSELIPGYLRLIYSLNPMVGIVDGMRWALFETPLDLLSMLVSGGATLISLIVGGFTFRSVERVLADVL
jgi:lipopolysaccharide transport system permease protein